MTRRATPRPTYSRPTVVRPEEAVHHLWGDEGSGFVGDEVLLSSDLLHALVFTLPPVCDIVAPESIQMPVHALARTVRATAAVTVPEL